MDPDQRRQCPYGQKLMVGLSFKTHLISSVVPNRSSPHTPRCMTPVVRGMTKLYGSTFRPAFEIAHFQFSVVESMCGICGECLTEERNKGSDLTSVKSTKPL